MLLGVGQHMYNLMQLHRFRNLGDAPRAVVDLADGEPLEDVDEKVAAMGRRFQSAGDLIDV